jgi:hypothetical protein
MLSVCGWRGVARVNREYPAKVHSLHAEVHLHTHTHTHTHTHRLFRHGHHQCFIASVATKGGGKHILGWRRPVVRNVIARSLHQGHKLNEQLEGRICLSECFISEANIIINHNLIEHEDSMFLRNAGICLRVYTASPPRRTTSSPPQ